MELKTARQIARLTQQQLADLAGVDLATISRIESGDVDYLRAAYATVVKIARALNVDPQSFFPVAHDAVVRGEARS